MKLYQTPEVDLLMIDTKDVITCSTGDGALGLGNDNYNPADVSGL